MAGLDPVDVMGPFAVVVVKLGTEVGLQRPDLLVEGPRNFPDADARPGEAEVGHDLQRVTASLSPASSASHLVKS